LDGRAVTWDVCRDRFAERSGVALEPIAAPEAGRHLAELASVYDLTLYETFLTDLAGHGRRGVSTEEAIGRLDGLLAGVLSVRSADTTVVLTSDHGNLEDTTTGGHTTNPVPLVAVGPAAGHFADLDSLLGVTPRILDVLGRA
jgi:bisphosphoglycerate-independent phosphoglycerate mutase (AlkP superfamily)